MNAKVVKVKTKATAAASNNKIFYDGKYKLSASTKTDSVVIYQKQDDGRYKRVDTVSETNDNYWAAVKRIHRMNARDASAAKISSAIERIAKASTVSAIKTKAVPLEQTVKAAIEEFSQATFTLDSNVKGVTRRYMVRAQHKRTVGTKKVLLDTSLFLVLPYDNSRLVKIDTWVGPTGVASAIERAKVDASLLKPASIVIMVHGENYVGETSNLSIKKVVHISNKESVEHVQQGLNNAIEKYFKRVNGAGSALLDDSGPKKN